MNLLSTKQSEFKDICLIISFLFPCWKGVKGGSLRFISKLQLPEILVILAEWGFSSFFGFGLQNHGKLGPLFSLLQLLLGLAEFSQIEGCNFFSLLNLLLVGLNLHLQFTSQVRHTVLVLSIFSLGESKLLSLALSPLEGLSCFTSARLGRCKFSFKLTNLHLKLSHG